MPDDEKDANLNQTLSIISMTKDKKEAEKDDLLLSRRNRKFKTEIAESSFEINYSINVQEIEKNKKITTSNFRHELMKRKISLQKRREDSRYKRFEVFKDQK